MLEHVCYKHIYYAGKYKSLGTCKPYFWSSIISSLGPVVTHTYDQNFHEKGKGWGKGEGGRGVTVKEVLSEVVGGHQSIFLETIWKRGWVKTRIVCRLSTFLPPPFPKSLDRTPSRTVKSVSKDIYWTTKISIQAKRSISRVSSLFIRSDSK